ncbi:MOSC domain-containing protein [Neobacillus ginsengisoli]|uniref:MOSC domain-containing protein YiiM n=1 Tax=Neobacillus ginsengisoli TaxID=904295 RepID=A0ABT9XQP0_9BACI|nr:MOSC domain-containing protein [Neobacillus ginsengisoli]MDQ0197713.1 MOSC domain-containing protein YiiM [Neobacillus ginsengisoli]
MNKPKIINIAIGMPKEYEWNNKTERSAINKLSVPNMNVKKSGIIGNEVANVEFHGGDDRAVCLYPFEHYAAWEKEFQSRLAIPAFGENITALGMLERDVCIGDVYQVGNAIIQVTQGRVPCSTISKFNAINQFLNRVYSTCYTGFFFRVLKDGVVTVESDIRLLEKHSKGISVLFANQTLFHDQKNQDAIGKILEVEELADVWRKKFMKLL